MALQQTLQTAAQREAFFISVGIPNEQATTYANNFVEQEMTQAELPGLSRDILKECGIRLIAHQMKITTAASQSGNPHPEQRPALATTSNSVTAQPRINGKLPQITSNMTRSQFRLCKSDWAVFKDLNPTLNAAQANNWLYQSCDDTVRNTLLDTVKTFRTMPEADLLDSIEQICTRAGRV